MSDSDVEPATVRAVLRARRQAGGWSARRLSLTAGLSESVMGKIESGEVQPTLRAFAAIVVQLGLNQHEITLLVRMAALDSRSGARR